MRRCALVLAVAFAAGIPGRAADLEGNWRFATVTGTAESNSAILKLETKDGKPCATVVFARPNYEFEVGDFKVSDKAVTLQLRQIQTFQGRKIQSVLNFVGVRGSDAKVILGSTGDDRFRSRAKLAATDKSEFAQNELLVRLPQPEPMQEIQKLSLKPQQLAAKLRQEEDEEKKKEITKEIAEARKEADAKIPGLYREIVEKHADSPMAYDAAMNLLRAPRAKITPADGDKFVALIKKQSEPYGPRFVTVTLIQLAEALIGKTGLEPAALTAIEPVAKGLSDSDPAAAQSRVLTIYVTALEKSGKTDLAKPIAERLATIEKKLDDEYLTKVPPFKPEHFAGRKEKDANQVVVMELFTGAQCPPCVAADVAFDALGHSYKPSELVLIQYHMHIPGPDPMVNPDCIARWDYYRAKLGANALRGTPSTLFNGVSEAGGGGGMANAESKFKQYRGIIDPLLEKSAALKVNGKAKRNGDKIAINIDVSGAEGDELKLRLVVVEDVVKFVGGNQLRFHHHVVRGLPGGAAGVAVKGKAFNHTATFDVADARQGLDKYLTTYAAEERPFPQPGRPMEMKNLKVIALVQDDAKGAILQAVQLDVE